MSTTVKHLGFIPKNRGEYASGERYYKDNIAQYHGSSYIASPTALINDGNAGTQQEPLYYLTRVPFDDGVLSAGWSVFASGNNVFSTGESVTEVGIDEEPVAGSENLVESGGVSKILDGETIYSREDITADFTTDKAYNFGDKSIGDTYNTWPNTYSGAICKAINVSAGEVYYINGSAGSNYQGLYVLTDSDHKIVEKLYIHPRNAGEVTVNVTSNGTLYVNLISYDSQTDKVEKRVETHTSGVIERLEDVEEIVDSLSENTPVVCVEQTLTSEQKSIARNNIGAASDDILNEVAVDQSTIDYGLLAGYTAYKLSGASITITNTDTGIHLSKSESANANYGFLLTNAPKTLLRIKYKSDKNLPDTINVYIDGSLVAVENIPANTKEYEFTCNFESGSVISLGYAMSYNISSVDLDIVVYDANATGLKVIADNLSERVDDIEENFETPIPHIISDENTFIGDGAGINNERSPSSDNGRYNTAMGKNAMRYNTAGDHCTAVGFCAMNKNTSGRNNTAFGEDALYENQTTGQNVAVGQHSLQDLTQGGYNVAIGSNVGRRTANATNTVIIGAEAYNTDDETGCNNSVMIGAYQRNTGNYDSVVLIHSDEPTADGQVRIGHPNSFSALFIGGKKINFNQDGSVTWEEISNS